MFILEDGRQELWQWDLDRRVIVSDASINEVHFCNKSDDCSLVVEVYEENGAHYANIPNILLQSDLRINIYGFDKNYTKHFKCYKVRKRTKPADYIYTETEILSFKRLEERINQIEENGVSDEAVADAIESYFAENPIEAGATAEQVAQIEKNTEDIAALKEKEPDLTAYYTKEETAAAIAAAQPDLEPYALKTGIPDTSNFLTEHQPIKTINGQSLVGEGNIEIAASGGGEAAAINEVFIGDQEPEDPNVELWIAPNATEGEFALKSDLPNLEPYALKTEIPDVSSFQTEEQVSALIDAALGVIENGTY